MATEYIDIVDTAVKIGLGALISGFTTYFVTSLKHTKEAEKETRIRKLDTIEEAAKHIDEYTNAFKKLLSTINGVHKSKPSREVMDLSNSNDAKAWEFICEYDVKFCNTREQKSFALSKLCLLGLTDIANSLSNIDEIENEIRDLVIFEHKIPDTKTTRAWQNNINKIKNDFYKSISSHYNA